MAAQPSLFLPDSKMSMWCCDVEGCKKQIDETKSGFIAYHKASHKAMWCCEVEGCKKKIDLTKKSTIAYHKGKHEPKYICTECGEAFPQKCNLDAHIRARHTREKPYQCDCCDKAFIQLNCLNSHKKRHHLVDKSDPSTIPGENPGPQHTGVVAC
jgi:KRAB domain-containing zinc finger protein